MQMTVRRIFGAACAAAFGATALAAATTAPAAAQASPTTTDPAGLVNPLIGTSNGGNVFPGAVLPFGMVAWSPEEQRPDPQRGPEAMRAAAAGGYQYETTRVRGFSLTHLSGTGCRGASGDVPFMPIPGTVTTSPSDDVTNEVYASDFRHEDETAQAGYYAVTLASGVKVELSSTLRTGAGRFTYPAGQPATMLVRTSDSEVGSSEAYSMVVRNARTITGSVSSGNFCGYIDPVDRRSYYTLHFVAVFDQPFAGTGEWGRSPDDSHGGTTYGTDGYPAPHSGSGVWVRFSPSASPLVVHVRVGISYVSEDNARANLDAEQPAGTTFEQVRQRARDAWNAMLGRIQATGGTADQRTIFYTALYHALLHLNLSSDVNGDYWGFDQTAHKVAAPQRAQYANFSGWDVYRSQLQLVTLLDPQIGADMAQSLLNQAAESGGEWDRWTHMSGETHVMEGDPAPSAVSSIDAFGGTSFDAKAAYASLKTAATVPTAHDLSNDGCNVECVGQRPSLDKWLTIHYIPTRSNAWGGAGETLEDVAADFSLSQLAARLGHADDARTFLARAQYWKNIYNPEAVPAANGQPAVGYIQNRNEDGTWPRVSPQSSNGFAEASSAVYTWMIPFDVRGLFDLMGGNATAGTRLDDFFHTTDGGWALTGKGGLHAEMDNEPSIGTPWLYLFAGEPYKTQDTVRATIDTLWKNAPGGIPGNDDLGAMSAWLVWAAMGLYPETPGRAELLVGSPLFSHIVITRANGKTITIDAPQAADNAPYVQSLKVDGRASTRPWLPESFVANGGRLEFVLGTAPNKAWGAAAADAPPSWGGKG